MHPIPSTAARRATLQKAAAGLMTLAAVALLALVVWQGLSSTARTEGNFIEAGSLSITDDNPNSSALFTVTNIADDAQGAKCITVTNDGTIDYDALTVARSNGTGDLGEDVTFTVTRINEDTDGHETANAVDTTSASCTAFDASQKPKAPVAVGGAASTGTSTTSDLSLLDQPGEAVSYKIAYHVDLANNDQGQSVNGITFSWAATQDGGSRSGEETGGGTGGADAFSAMGGLGDLADWDFTPGNIRYTGPLSATGLAWNAPGLFADGTVTMKYNVTGSTTMMFGLARPEALQAGDLTQGSVMAMATTSGTSTRRFTGVGGFGAATTTIAPMGQTAAGNDLWVRVGKSGNTVTFAAYSGGPAGPTTQLWSQSANLDAQQSQVMGAGVDVLPFVMFFNNATAFTTYELDHT
jgi:hypothetical protein